jgi:hypothetical protein
MRFLGARMIGVALGPILVNEVNVVTTSSVIVGDMRFPSARSQFLMNPWSNLLFHLLLDRLIRLPLQFIRSRAIPALTLRPILPEL